MCVFVLLGVQVCIVQVAGTQPEQRTSGVHGHVLCTMIEDGPAVYSRAMYSGEEKGLSVRFLEWLLIYLFCYLCLSRTLYTQHTQGGGALERGNRVEAQDRYRGCGGGDSECSLSDSTQKLPLKTPAQCCQPRASFLSNLLTLTNPRTPLYILNPWRRFLLVCPLPLLAAAAVPISSTTFIH